MRDAEDRESNLIAEISELREQNELLEFRVLELEESPNQRESPDLADSGIVSPEPIHLYKVWFAIFTFVHIKHQSKDYAYRYILQIFQNKRSS